MDIVNLKTTTLVERGNGVSMQLESERAKEDMFEKVKPFIKCEYMDDPYNNNLIIRCTLKVAEGVDRRSGCYTNYNPYNEEECL